MNMRAADAIVSSAPKAMKILPISEVWSQAEESLLDALESSTTDFRTLASLREEIGADRQALDEAIARLLREGVVRRPATNDPRFNDWYRLSSLGRTWRERLLFWRAIAGRDTV